MEINISTDSLSNINFFSYYWAIALATATSFYWFTRLVGSHLNDNAKKELSNWLEGKYESTWSLHFCRLFDSVFGDKHLSLKRLIRSIIVSALSVILLYIMFRYVLGVLGTRTLVSVDVLKVLLLGMLINLIPDYLSLIETRWLLERFSKTKSLLGQALLLIADFLFTASIILASIYLYTYIIEGEIPSPILIIALFSIYAIFFYSTFISSIWAWVYCLTTWFIRLFTRIGLNKILKVKEEPVKQIAFIGAGIILIGMLSLAPSFKSTKQGEATVFDDFLCRMNLKTCFHLARTNDDLGLTVHFMELACENETEENNCAVRLEEEFDEKPGAILKIWQQACEGDYFRACRALGYYYQHGDETIVDYSKAKRFFQKACDGENMGGCNNLGILYNNGDGVTQDYNKAAALFQKACEGNNLSGCNGLGTLYQKGNSVEQDYDKAAALYQQACEGDYMLSCNNLGILYNNGDGVTQDYNKAAALFQKACEGNNLSGCNGLGTLYQKGNSVEQDYDKAAALFQKACDGNNMWGCNGLGTLYQKGNSVEQDYDKAAALFQKACDGNNMWGCSNLGISYENGDGVEQDNQKAIALYRQACEGGVSDACDWAKELENK